MICSFDAPICEFMNKKNAHEYDTAKCGEWMNRYEKGIELHATQHNAMHGQFTA